MPIPRSRDCNRPGRRHLPPDGIELADQETAAVFGPLVLDPETIAGQFGVEQRRAHLHGKQFAGFAC